MPKSTLTQLIESLKIIESQSDADDLESLIADLKIGDKVVFTHNKNTGPMFLTGTIVKFNDQSISIETPRGIVRVPFEHIVQKD